jgi:hypothetical protein
MAWSNLVWEELNLKIRKSHCFYDPHHIVGTGGITTFPNSTSEVFFYMKTFVRKTTIKFFFDSRNRTIILKKKKIVDIQGFLCDHNNNHFADFWQVIEKI